MAAKKKTKRKAPRVQRWLDMGCEGVTREGRMRKGWRPPAKKGDCPRPGKGGKRTRATRVKSCLPLIKKGTAVGFKRGFSACEKMLPADLRAEVKRREEQAGEDFARSYGIPTVNGLGRARGGRRRKKSRGLAGLFGKRR